jgi:hypothetical protein
MAGEDVQSPDEPGSRGLNRRQMIKASAIAGAAAWTAPMIIDSLTSPAAAYSGPCTKYYVKITVRYGGTGGNYSHLGECYCQDPACGSNCPTSSCSASGYNHLCSGGTSFCTLASSPSITFSGAAGTGNKTITLNDSNCFFSQDRGVTNFDGVGNYNFGTGSQNCVAATIGGGGKVATYADASGTLDFVYAEFCCT